MTLCGHVQIIYFTVAATCTINCYCDAYMSTQQSSTINTNHFNVYIKLVVQIFCFVNLIVQ